MGKQDQTDNYDLSSFLNPALFPFAPQELLNRDPYFNTDPERAMKEISTVPELAGIRPMPGGVEFTAQNIDTDLMGLRAQMPFLPIAQWPKSIRGVFLPTAGVPGVIEIPSGAVLGRFTGTADYFVSMEGQAQIPTATTPSDIGSIFRPEWAWWYIGGVTQPSIVSSVANAYVQLVCLSPKPFPER